MDDLLLELTEPYLYTFKNIAMNHFGGITLKDEKKAYTLIITCMKTRATELYVTEDKGVESLLLALKRFITRWDIPHKIITDTNATFKATFDVTLIYINFQITLITVSSLTNFKPSTTQFLRP